MADPKYIVGIDLGTTHCALSYAPADAATQEEPTPFRIPQLVNPGEVDGRLLLPSFMLLPGPHDVPEGGLRLPWTDANDYAVGAFARERGAELPSRLVASAKSWLCHTGVDRTADLLPWEGPDDVQQVSPVEAARRYLLHLRNAWNHEMAADDPDARLEDLTVLLTVPASFDAVARELTVRAAQEAGLPDIILLEEPQAAFYAWLAAQGDDWRDAIGVGDSVLVCDVGGGTTDFSLIEVVEEDGALDLQRVAVGEHITLGGDNMDLTLAYAVRHKVAQQGTQLDNWQFRALTHQCRKAKEHLLSDPTATGAPVVISGRGSSLIGGSIRTELTRDEIQNILTDGFFPHGALTDHPERKPKVGMREMGLPYASDPAITRHLAAFLHRHVNADGGTAFPSAVLFNGGVMKAEGLRARILEVLQDWSGEAEVRALPAPDLDTAVARGACYYGGAREGRGIRIRAGAPRAYYIAVESNMPAVPGVPTPLKALCVLPFGTEEGSALRIPEKEFGLVVGEDAVFTLLASTTRTSDEAGAIVDDWGGEIEEVATMEARFEATSEEASGTVIPVVLESAFTEVGTLELYCATRDGEHRRKLEFNIRETQEA